MLNMKILTLLLCAALTVMAAPDHSNMERGRERRDSCSSTPSPSTAIEGFDSHFDQLQTIYKQLTRERDQLKTSNNQMTQERDQLQTSNNQTTQERDQLQSSYNQLTRKRDQLQSSYNQLTQERDQLQTSNNQTTQERDQLQSSYNQLTRKRDQLQSSYNQLTQERDQLQTSNNQMTQERDQLQSSYNQLSQERDQLKTSYNQLTQERDCLKRRLCESNGFTFADGLCYYVSTVRKNWQDSRQWCRDRQSDLIVVKSREKQDIVLRANKRVWLGLTDRDREGSYRWLDGTPLTTPTFWYPGEPNSYGGDEDCVENYDGSVRVLPGRGWNDSPCSASFYWICERVLC